MKTGQISGSCRYIQSFITERYGYHNAGNYTDL